MSTISIMRIVFPSAFPILIFTVLILPFFSLAQEPDSAALPGIFDLLYAQDIAEITVKSDLSYLVENKKSSDEYIDGEFKFELEKNVTQTLPVKVKCRGRYRRMKCDFPPFKLKFKKDDLAAHGLNEFNELKLVTHCMDEKERSKDLILREYLTYQLYNILTPNSFRAQLVKVTYLNTKGKPNKIKGWGILIEDSDELAHRIGGSKEFFMGLPDSCFNPRQEKITALFNYMIGNTDWSTKLARNLEMIKCPDSSMMIVPYDFDFAGLVNAPYAVPNNIIGQKNIRDRVYLGRKCPLSEFTETFQLFKEKKEEIFATIKNANNLSIQSKSEMSEYLAGFYDTIEDEEKARSVISDE